MKVIGWLLLLTVVGCMVYLMYIQLRPVKYSLRDDLITISGNSMAPSLKDGQHYQVNLCPQGQCGYQFQRGDLAIYKQPPNDIEQIKRVIGLPQETITLSQGQVYINDQFLKEPYLVSSPGATLLPSDQSCLELTLTGSQYFLLGDNRQESHDNREDGTISRQDILSYLPYTAANPNTPPPSLLPTPPPPCSSPKMTVLQPSR